MNAFQRARATLEKIPALLNRSAEVRQQAQQRLPVRPRATQLRITGNGMVRVVDADTGAVLGFRQTIREARVLQQQLERGLTLQGVA